MEQNKLIDLTYLFEVTDGDMSFVNMLVQQFFDDTPILLDELFKTSEQNDTYECGKLLHKLKSSYTVFGVDELLDGHVLLHKKPIDENDVCVLNDNKEKILANYSQIQKEITIFIETYPKEHD